GGLARTDQAGQAALTLPRPAIAAGVFGPFSRPRSAFRSRAKCSRPATMNRIGLIVALGLAALAVILFALFPGLDLALARLFFDSASGTFLLQTNGIAAVLRDGAMWLSWAFAAPSIVAFVVKMIWPNKPLLVKGRTVAFLLITITLSAGVLSNLTFK